MSDLIPAAYRAAFERWDTVGIITDASFRIVNVTEGFVTFTGYDLEEVVGEPPVALFSDESIYDELLGALSTGQTWEGRMHAVTGSGREVVGETIAYPIVVDGEIFGYAGFFTERTEYEQYERSVSVLNRVLRHDLRNRLNVVEGYAERLADEGSAEDLETLERIRKTTRGLLKTASTARQLERTLSLDPETYGPVDVTQVLSECVDVARRRTPSATFELETPEAAVCIASEPLGRVFDAVLENAVIHHDRPDPVVEVSCRIDGDEVVVEVSDDGPGIPPTERGSLFGRNDDDPLRHGSGIDLYLSRCLMERFDGSIDVLDSATRGATFELRLPAADE